jgi:NADH:ubiquinone oxidoreductase subunit 2 (subunit N)
MVVLAAIAAVNAVIALFYYARVVKTIWMDPAPEALSEERRATPVAGSLGLALGLAAAFVVVVGFFPQISAFFGEAGRVVASGG